MLPSRIIASANMPFADQARLLPSEVYDAGLRDGDTCGALADLYLRIDPRRSRELAMIALAARSSCWLLWI
ncbi:MAG TPA: hypothetical protein VFE62_14235 [Gemmataceae bacterium]|nr:hypothetical protein [Gemmataceae bacterium]